MAAAIFENIVDSNFGDKASSKGAPFAPKTDSSEFRNLIKDKTSQPQIDYSRSGVKTKVESDRVAESISTKKVHGTKEQVAEETSTDAIVNVDTLVTEDQSGISQEVLSTLIPIEETVLVAETEDDIIPEEDLDQREEDIVPAIDLPQEQDDEVKLSNLVSDFIDNSVDEENIVVHAVLPEITRLADSGNVDKTSAAFSTDEALTQSLDITELPAEDQAVHQSLKTFDLPTGFVPDDVSRDIELLTDKPQITPKSDSDRKLEELGSKLDAPIKLVVDEVKSGKNTVENTKPIIVAHSLNLALADNTRHGKNIISRMQTPDSDKNAAVVSEGEEFVLDNEAIVPNLGDKDNSSAGQRSSSSLEAFGAVIEQANDETFEITFKAQDFGSKRSEMPKPAMQVSLAVSEVLNSSSASGKKQITINLYPQTLGAVKVEILSQVGHDGASKVESIKISADKHDTLVMLEERRAELAKSLKEVNGTEEKEAHLQFEMSQDQGKGQGAYFTSLEERNNWMSKFVGLIADDELQTENNSHEVDEYATRGIITEDKVDLVA
ncbi:MAG: hypothetical protein AAF673_00420 [Pseudomonadota bacterium]